MLTAEEWRRIGAVYGVDVGPMLREQEAARAEVREALTEAQRTVLAELRRVRERYGVRLDDEQLRALALEMEANDAG